MRLPRLRFTLRWMMVAVAVVGLSLGIERMSARRADFLSRAEVCADRAYDYTNGFACFKLNAREGIEVELGNYWNSLASKYRTAARYPWLSVEPDPPYSE